LSLIIVPFATIFTNNRSFAMSSFSVTYTGKLTYFFAAAYSAAFPGFSPLGRLPDGINMENPYKVTIL